MTDQTNEPKPAAQPEDDNPRGEMPENSTRVAEVDTLTPSQRAHFDQLQAQWSGRPDQTTPPQAGAQ